jgi:hypothetical protein
MRKVGIGALGLIGGVLLAVVVQDLLARAFVRDGAVPLPLALVLGFMIPVFAVLGVVGAILADNRRLRRNSKATPDG